MKIVRLLLVALILAGGVAQAVSFGGPEPTPTCDPADPSCQIIPPNAL